MRVNVFLRYRFMARFDGSPMPGARIVGASDEMLRNIIARRVINPRG
jgi:hypothetical protein